VRLQNPLILAAMYYDPRIIVRAMGLGFGAVTTKSITLAPRAGHPQPNLARVRTAAGPGLVNCNGFQNPGLERFRAAFGALPHRVPLIVSVAGESVEEYVTLVRELRRIERELGRVPHERYGPRELDLDLLLFAGAAAAEHEGNVAVPHERIAERRFVLGPLAELAPDATDPRSGRSVRELLAAVADQRAEPIEDRGWWKTASS